METNGSTLTTSVVLSATAGTSLSFFFNYVTSDGAGFSDYAWAELFNSSKSPVALLFTARTEMTGSIVPGTGLPNPLATSETQSFGADNGWRTGLVAAWQFLLHVLCRRLRIYWMGDLELHDRDRSKLLPLKSA